MVGVAIVVRPRMSRSRGSWPGDVGGVRGERVHSGRQRRPGVIKRPTAARRDGGGPNRPEAGAHHSHAAAGFRGAGKVQVAGGRNVSDYRGGGRNDVNRNRKRRGGGAGLDVVGRRNVNA